MRVIFAGPSWPSDIEAVGFELRPPVVQGDIIAAIDSGANVIGIVDGNFEATASVWHKEILFALSLGVGVFGSSSMGALRAAECEAFGMIPIGKIANDYASGVLDDDAAVAQSHGPSELGYPALTEPLVDCQATLEYLGVIGLLTLEEAEIARLSAETVFFKDRTVEAIVEAANFFGCQVLTREMYFSNRVSQKKVDARLLANIVSAQPDIRQSPSQWHFCSSPFWDRALRDHRQALG